MQLSDGRAQPPPLVPTFSPAHRGRGKTSRPSSPRINAGASGRQVLVNPIGPRLWKSVASRMLLVLHSSLYHAEPANKRRRWLAALGLFLVTAIGGVIAYLVARRQQKGPASPEEAPVSELSARLRQAAATQERRVRRRSGADRGPGRWFRRRPAVETAGEPSSAEETPPMSGGETDAET